MRLRHGLFILLVLFGIWRWWGSREIAHTPGQIAAETPEQTDIAGNPPHFEKNGYTLTGLARFRMTARALAVEPYRLGREADLSPVDVAFGWGPMSDSEVLSGITITQGGRFYHWHTAQFPIPRRQIELNSANMHLIPANGEVERHMNGIHVGSIVELSGYLVEAKARDGWTWRSSLTREDTGNGACELIWVEALDVRR